ncbi:MAG: dienelactone hydrolase family protein [Microbacterium ginsengisoli]|jgi:phospholipase/carboxylesterase|uniref:alpha/beta hydrolase n=2 Tax=Microbacteriaceae TaxID=85023 RepID=UPI0007017F84|nr:MULTISPECIES: dienelactone hydrolase family protein [unclassified Microbacterium]KQR92127.1 hypothetical protein ASF93_05875 [Microbacterium sp. Leaf347]MBN9197740.1 dienelactone hydrolase family protein [Microbacterium ginsengisoli]ODU79819.1 MAG: hypothetical protein ABT08_00605 [Microbacterium sp. SCN 71-21]OJU79342.1 MAG: hypothetical protein BGO15_10560 [Microbacterium sp. 71-23]
MLIRETAASDPLATSAPVVALLLHGYGASERDLAGIGDRLTAGLPWVSLRAPLALPQGGAAWFPVTVPGSPDPQPVVEATEAIWTWVQENLLPDARIVPIGFSQGGLMASQLLRTRPERVAATAVLGGFVLGAAQPADPLLRRMKPEAFWARGDADRVIATPAVERTEAWLPSHTTLTARVYPGLGHAIDQRVLDDLAVFLAAAVPLGASTI